MIVAGSNKVSGQPAGTASLRKPLPKASLMKLTTLVHIFCLTAFGGMPLVAQSNEGAGSDPDQPVRDAAALPPGWTARPDAKGDAAQIKFVTMEPGYHLTLGPATILYRKENLVKGPFHSQAKIHQMKKLEHAEGYGLFLGGQNLDGERQSYTYFLVRADGKFTIKRREGEKVSEVVGWKSHPAINKADAGGKATNLLEIDAKLDPKQVSFKANGQEVHSMPARGQHVKGLVGLRVNHNLDVHIEGFAIHE